jgi:hypothetical protein
MGATFVLSELKHLEVIRKWRGGVGVGGWLLNWLEAIHSPFIPKGLMHARSEVTGFNRRTSLSEPLGPRPSLEHMSWEHIKCLSFPELLWNECWKQKVTKMFICPLVLADKKLGPGKQKREAIWKLL